MVLLNTGLCFIKQSDVNTFSNWAVCIFDTEMEVYISGYSSTRYFLICYAVFYMSDVSYFLYVGNLGIIFTGKMKQNDSLNC